MNLRRIGSVVVAVDLNLPVVETGDSLVVTLEGTSKGLSLILVFQQSDSLLAGDVDLVLNSDLSGPLSVLVSNQVGDVLDLVLDNIVRDHLGSAVSGH